MQEAGAAIAPSARFFMPRSSASLVQIAPAALAGAVVGELAGDTQNLPLADSQNGSVFQDRFSATLAWYLPALSLAADVDAAFAFNAVVSSVTTDGDPFDQLTLGLGVSKQMPPDAAAFAQQNPTFEMREIPLAALAATLTTSSNDPQTGTAQSSSYPGTLTVRPDGGLCLTFGPLLGAAVIVAYANLQTGGASVAMTGSYAVWRRVTRIGHPIVRPPFPNTGGGGGSPAFRPRLMMMRPIFSDPSVRVGDGPIDDSDPVPIFRQSNSAWSANFTPADKYAGVGYATKYTLTDKSITSVITGAADLKNFNTRQSQFSEFTALGDISQKYSSFRALYIGAISRSIVAVPARYGIVRSSSGTAAVCRALLDTSASGNGNCKFEFSFLLGPVISPIDLIGLSNDVAASSAAHDCTVTVPLQFDETGSLPTPFASSASFTPGAVAGTFGLTVTITDQGATTSAVANANLFIKALTAQVEPFLAGQTAIKLDDFYERPVPVDVLLNFSQTSGSDDVGFTVAPDGSTVVLSNRSPLDLNVSRYAVAANGQVNVQTLQQQVLAKQSASIPIAPTSGALSVLVERTLALEPAFTPPVMQRYLAFDVVDVADVAYQLGVVAAGVSFAARGIAKIDVAIVVTNLPSLTVPGFSLSDLNRSGNEQITIPVMSAITTLQATIAFTVTPASGAPVQFTATNDFIDDPVFVLTDAQIAGFPPATS